MPCPWLGSSASPMAPSRGPPAEPAGTTGPWALPEFPLPSPSPGMGPGNAGIQVKGGRMGHPVPCLAMERHAAPHCAGPSHAMQDHTKPCCHGHARQDRAVLCWSMLPHAIMAMGNGPFHGHSMDGQCRGCVIPRHPLPCYRAPAGPNHAMQDNATPCYCSHSGPHPTMPGRTKAGPKQDQGTPCHPMPLHLCCAEPCHAGQCQPTLLRPCQAASCHAGPCHPLLPWPY